MIYSLSGKLLLKTADEAVIECGGVGYQVFIPSSAQSALPPLGQQCTLYTYMNVTENLIALFGFADIETKKTFGMLITVSGVGPKAGLSILSALSPERIILAIQSGDYKAFTVASGVGPKLAQRIILELKDKVGKGFASASASMSAESFAITGSIQQAMAALNSLGYSTSEAATALAKLDAELPVQELIRLALQGMGKGR
ncbi:MAG: Holliday junction branch migration protein RuvA [Oscillospiraceae bacterium]